jgi:hypothetical protein
VVKRDFLRIHHKLNSEARMKMTSARCFFVLLYLCFAAVPAWSGEGRTVEAAILESQVMLRQDDAQQAREILEEAVAGSPGEPKLYLHLGNVYRELGWTDEAVAAYRQAVQIHPGFSGAFEALAGLYRQLEKWDDAIAAYQRLAAIDASAARPHFEMAMIYRGQGFAEQEKRELRQAYRLNPQFVVQAARLQQVELAGMDLAHAGDEEPAGGAGTGDEAAGAKLAGAGAPGAVSGSTDTGAGQPGVAAVSGNDPGLPGKKEETWPGHTLGRAILLLLAALLLAWGSVRVRKGRR